MFIKDSINYNCLNSLMKVHKVILILLNFLLAPLVQAQQTFWGSQQEKGSIYSIQDSVMIRTRDGAEISAMVVRKKNDNVPRPAVLQFTIYVRDQGRDMQSLKEAADRGYVGVMAYTRGKRFSKSEIYPYETD